MRGILLIVCLCGVTALGAYYLGKRNSTGVVDSYLRSRVVVVDSLTLSVDAINRELDKMITDARQTAEKAKTTGDQILDSGYEASAEFRFDRHARETQDLIAEAQIEIAKATLLVVDSELSIISSHAKFEHQARVVHELAQAARKDAESAMQELKQGNADGFGQALNRVVASTFGAAVAAKNATELSKTLMSDINTIRSAGEFITTPKRYSKELE